MYQVGREQKRSLPEAALVHPVQPARVSVSQCVNIHSCSRMRKDSIYIIVFSCHIDNVRYTSDLIGQKYFKSVITIIPKHYEHKLVRFHQVTSLTVFTILPIKESW